MGRVGVVRTGRRRQRPEYQAGSERAASLWKFDLLRRKHLPEERHRQRGAGERETLSAGLRGHKVMS